MVAGNSDKFALLVEKVSDWSSCGYTNGIINLYINGAKYPKENITVTLNMEIDYLTADNSPLINPITDEILFSMEKHKLFSEFCKAVFDNGNYRYQLPFSALKDDGWCVFMVSSADMVRIQLGRYTETEGVEYADETVISKKELGKTADVLKKIKV